MEGGAATEARFTDEEHAFLLARVQPALIGLIDGSLSTLAPIFAVALATQDPHVAFFAGLATAIGAAVSMGFSGALSDTGELTGRGSPWERGAITGGGTFVGGVFHTLPFLIDHYHAAIVVGIITVAIELVVARRLDEAGRAADERERRAGGRLAQELRVDAPCVARPAGRRLARVGE